VVVARVWGYSLCCNQTKEKSKSKAKAKPKAKAKAKANRKKQIRLGQILKKMFSFGQTQMCAEKTITLTHTRMSSLRAQIFMTQTQHRRISEIKCGFALLESFAGNLLIINKGCWTVVPRICNLAEQKKESK
jgi:hypothetical protein